MAYVFLAIAIISEVAATSALAASRGLTRAGPVAVMVVGYAIAFLCLSMTVRTIPVGVAYAIWSGAGIVLISLVGVFWLGQKLDMAAIVGLLFIATGVAIVQGLSTTARL
jgi:small multidrug resistance pump